MPPDMPPDGCASGAGGFFACPGNSPPSGTPTGPGQGLGNPGDGGTGGSTDGPTPNPGDDGGGDLTGSLGRSNMCQRADLAGDPIVTGTGNVYHAELDYSSPSGLRFVRSYNSGMPGWAHNFQLRVIADSTRADLIRPGGKILSFTGNGLGPWSTNPTVVGQLTKLDEAANNGAQWKFVDSNDTTELYNAAGMPISITGRSGRALSFASVGNLLQSVTDPWGRSIGFVYDTNNRLSSITPPGSAAITYQYDGQGRLAFVTYQDATTRQYVYEDTAKPLLLTGIIDENNTRFVTWGYDSQGRAINTTQALGANAAQLVYGVGSTQVTDALNTQRTLQFASVSGKQIFAGATEPCANCYGDAAAQTIDTNGLPTQHTDHRGVQRLLGWDSIRKLPTSQTRAAGKPEAQTTTTQWHPNWRLPSLVTESNAAGTPLRSTAYTYDTLSNLLNQATTEHATNRTRTTQWDYNAQGLVQTMTDARNNVWSYGYDTQGNRTSVTNPLSQTVTYGYDAAGYLTSMTDPNGVVTSYSYDARQRLQSATVGGQTTAYTYHPTGQLKRVTAPEGSWLDFEYDAAQRLTAITDKPGNRIAYTLDAMGNQVTEQVKDPAGTLRRQIQRSVNALNRVQQTTGEF